MNPKPSPELAAAIARNPAATLPESLDPIGLECWLWGYEDAQAGQPRFDAFAAPSAKAAYDDGHRAGKAVGP